MKKNILVFILFMFFLYGCETTSGFGENITDGLIQNKEFLGLLYDHKTVNDHDSKNNQISTDNNSVELLPVNLKNGIPQKVQEYYKNKLMWLNCCTDQKYFQIYSSFSYYSDKYKQIIVVSGIDKDLGTPVKRKEKIKYIFCGKVKYENDTIDKEATLKNFIEYTGNTEESNYSLAFTIYDNSTLDLSYIANYDVGIGDKIYIVGSGGTYYMTGDDMFECEVEKVNDNSFYFSTENNPYCKYSSGGIILDKNGYILGIHVYNEDDIGVGYKIKNIIEDIEGGSISEKEYPEEYIQW